MTDRRIEELILVYSARSGIASAIVDSAKKLLQLKGCTLCTITHRAAVEDLTFEAKERQRVS